MLDQVMLAAAIDQRMADQPPNRIELVIAGKDQSHFSRLLSLIVLHVEFVDEVLQQIQDAILRPDPLPKILRRIAALYGGLGGIACASIFPLVEGRNTVFAPCRRVVT